MIGDTATAARLAVKNALTNRGLRVEEHSDSRRIVLRAHGKAGNSVAVLTRGKRAGTWQGSIDDPLYDPSPGSEFYWVFVDLSTSLPLFFVCPGSYVAADIDRAHAKYLEHHGGRRAESNESKHHAIRLHRVEGWRDVWAPLVYQANLTPQLAQSW